MVKLQCFWEKQIQRKWCLVREIDIPQQQVQSETELDEYTVK